MGWIGWHRSYQRTCTSCGLRWTVARALAGPAPSLRAQRVARRATFAMRIPPSSLSSSLPGLRSLPEEVELLGDRLEWLHEEMRVCRRCGSETFTQRAARPTRAP